MERDLRSQAPAARTPHCPAWDRADEARATPAIKPANQSWTAAARPLHLQGLIAGDGASRSAAAECHGSPLPTHEGAGPRQALAHTRQQHLSLSSTRPARPTAQPPHATMCVYARPSPSPLRPLPALPHGGLAAAPGGCRRGVPLPQAAPPSCGRPLPPAASRLPSPSPRQRARLTSGS